MSTMSHEDSIAFLDVILVTLELMLFPIDVLDKMTLARNVFAANPEADLTSLACKALIGAMSHIAYAEAPIDFFVKLFLSRKKAKDGTGSAKDDAHKAKEMERTYTEYLLATQAAGETAVGSIMWFDAHNFDMKMWKECRAIAGRREMHVDEVYSRGIQIIFRYWTEGLTEGKSVPNTCPWAKDGAA